MFWDSLIKGSYMDGNGACVLKLLGFGTGYGGDICKL